MDLLSHFIWSYALFRGQPWLWAGVAFCVLPDIIWWAAMMVRRHALRRSDYKFRDVQVWYRASHSLVTQAVAAAAALLLFGPSAASGVAAGWLLHIFMDVWTHKGGVVQGVAVFYPLSNWRFPAICWWSELLLRHKWIYLVNLAAAAVVAGFVALPALA